MQELRKRSHLVTGVDYGWVNTIYANVMAIADGEVVDNFYSSSCGYSLVIKHTVDGGKHRFATFIHLKEKSKLSIGTKVKQGDVVGIRGNTGKSSGPHLHFGLTEETTKSYYWNIVKELAVNPQPLMKKKSGITYYGEMFKTMPLLSEESSTKELEDKIVKLTKELEEKNALIKKLQDIISKIKELVCNF